MIDTLHKPLQNIIIATTKKRTCWARPFTETTTERGYIQGENGTQMLYLSNWKRRKYVSEGRGLCRILNDAVDILERIA